MRKYLSALLADPALQPAHGAVLPIWLEQQIDPALERGQITPARITIQQAVGRSPAMVLLGPAGSGKSMLLRQLARELAQEALENKDAPLPLYVPLSFFDGSIEGTLGAQARARGPSLATLALARPCILIVDALNDLPPADQMAALRMLRRALSSLGPQGRWIIACRSEDWGLFDAFLPSGRFQVWRVRPWSDQAVLNAVQRQEIAAAERLLRLPGAIELARRPRWLGALLQAPGGLGSSKRGRFAEDALPGPLLCEWITATAVEAARTHCLPDQCAQHAIPLLQDLGAMLQRRSTLNSATIAGVVADSAAEAGIAAADLQALLDALAFLQVTGDDEWALRSALLGDLREALDLEAELGARLNSAGAELPPVANRPTPLALLYGMLPTPQPLLRTLIRTGAWEATQHVLDANVAPDEALAILEETDQIDTSTAAALGRAWAHSGSREVAIALLEWTVQEGRDDPYLFGLIGHLHRQAGNWQEARTNYQEALRRDPTNLDYQQALAHVCQELGEADTATTTLEGLLNAHHIQLAATAYQLGSLHEHHGRFREALEQFTRAAALCPSGTPDHGRFHLAKARVLRQLGNHEEAAQILGTLDNDKADAVELADENAALLEATGNDQQALERLSEIEDRGSATPTTYLRMAELHRRRDEQGQADRAYRAAIELDPRRVEAYEGIAEIAVAANDIPTAVSAYERIVDLEPNSADAWRRLGALQRQAGSYAESSRSLLTSLRIAPSAETQLEMARTRWAQGDQVAALSFYRGAATNDREGRMAAEAGWALLESGDLTGAQAMLERAATLRPADGRVLFDLGRCYEAQGGTTRALEWFMQAAHVAPSVTTLRATGRAARILGERSIARQMLARALRADRRNGETAAEVGRLHLEEGRADLAATSLQRARAAGVEDIEVQRDLAEALLRLGDAHSALMILESIPVDDNDFQSKRSRAYELLGDPQGALNIARAAAARQPRNAMLQRRVGALALQANLPGEALVALETARTLGDKEQETLIDLSRAMLLTDRVTAALKTVDEALLRIEAGAADDPRVHVQRGTVLLELQDWSEARRAFEHALSLLGDRPQDPRARRPGIRNGRELTAEAWAGLAEAYGHIAGATAALPYARHALELAPGSQLYKRLVGRLLLEAGDLSAARAALADERAPEPATLRLRMQIEIADHRWAAATPLAARCHALMPNDLEITAGYGTALLHSGKPDEALPLLETVCNAPGASAASWASLGRCHLRLDNIPAALQAFNRSLEARPDDPLTHAALAEAHLAQGASGAAAHALRQALELAGDRHPDAVRWRTALARAYMSQGWYAEALAEWERTRMLVPTDTVVRLEMAATRLKLGSAEAALVDLEALVAEHPDHGAAWQLLSRAALVAGDAPRAVYAAACALSQRPHDPALRLLLAEAALADGDPRRAYDALTPLVETDAPEIKALLLVNRAAHQLNDPAAAHAALEKAGRLASGDPDVQLAMAEHLQIIGKGPRAVKLLSHLFGQHGDSAPIAASIAELAFKGGAIELARQAAERAVSLSPQDTGYARLLGHICYAEGDHTTARRALQQAMKGRQDPATALLLGKLALERGEATEAKRLLRLAHDHQPGDAETTGWLALALRQPFEPVLEDEAPEPQSSSSLEAAIMLLRQVEHEAAWRAELGWTLVLTGDYLEAIAMLNSAARAPELPTPQTVVALRRVGLVLLSQGRAGDATTPLERAAELDPSEATVFSLLGQVAEIQGDLHTAIQRYSAATAVDPDNGRHHLRLGQVLLQRGETEAALEHLGRATELEPARASGWTALSRALLHNRQVDHAFAAAQRAVQLTPSDGLAWRQVAAAAEARNDIRIALDALERAVAHPPEESGLETANGARPAPTEGVHPIVKEWLLHYAHLAIAHGETERGRVALQSASDLDPSDADLLHQLAQFYGPAERIALLQRAIQIKPSKAAWRTELANLLAARGDHRPALDQLQSAIEAEPGNPAHWIALARAHMQMGDDLQAERTLLRAGEVVDEDPGIYVTLGELLSSQGRWSEALHIYDQAVRLEPTADRHSDRGRCLEVLGRLEEAQKALERALELEPGHARAATHLAEIYLLRDPHEGWRSAIRFARMATDNAPGELAGYKVRARAALGGRWKEEFKAALEHARALAPDDPELHELQGWYYLNEGKNRLALEEAEQAIEFDRGSARPYFLQAEIFKREQRFLDAVNSLRIAANLDGNFREALKELTALGIEAIRHRERK